MIQEYAFCTQKVYTFTIFKVNNLWYVVHPQTFWMICLCFFNQVQAVRRPCMGIILKIAPLRRNRALSFVRNVLR